MDPVDAHIFAPCLLKYILSPVFLRMAVKNDTRVAMPKINQSELSRILVPVPPVAEQRRIVASVDQLMALCDALEVRQRRRVEKRTQLNKASLHRLMRAGEDEELLVHWRRIRDNFDLLYDAPETVRDLRQAVLQLALRGRLVPQDPSDEPASALLERIQAKKQRLYEVGEIRKPKELPPLKPLSASSGDYS